jgi:hypothetical protein
MDHPPSGFRERTRSRCKPGDSSKTEKTSLVREARTRPGRGSSGLGTSARRMPPSKFAWATTGEASGSIEAPENHKVLPSPNDRETTLAGSGIFENGSPVVESHTAPPAEPATAFSAPARFSKRTGAGACEVTPSRVRVLITSPSEKETCSLSAASAVGRESTGNPAKGMSLPSSREKANQP